MVHIRYCDHTRQSVANDLCFRTEEGREQRGESLPGGRCWAGLGCLWHLAGQPGPVHTRGACGPAGPEPHWYGPGSLCSSHAPLPAAGCCPRVRSQTGRSHADQSPPSGYPTAVTSCRNAVVSSRHVTGFMNLLIDRYISWSIVELHGLDRTSSADGLKPADGKCT